MSATNGAIETDVSYEDLAALEVEFDEVDTEILRKQYELSAPLYSRRSELISKIPNFWPLVFEEVPVEVERFIQPSDSALFAACLNGVELDRFEIDTQPRSFSLRFTFSSNQWFEDEVLEKKFWYRRATDNWVGLVSEPVKINWKKNGDLTHGITDAAHALWQSSKAMANGSISIGKTKGTADYEALVKKLENSDISYNSFFTLFSFISGRRWVSAEESKEANAAEEQRRKKRAAGQTVEEPEEEDPSTEDVDTMVCPFGDDLAQFIAEDVFPNAIKYFTTANSPDNDELSEPEFEMEDDSEESESDEEVDIRALVKGKSHKRKQKASESASPPPAARQKTTK